jgi:hypothetical protein
MIVSVSVQSSKFKVQSSKNPTRKEILLVVLPACPTLHLSPSIDDFIFLLPSVCLKISFTVVRWLLLAENCQLICQLIKVVTTLRCETICGLLCDAWKTILNTLFD